MNAGDTNVKSDTKFGKGFSYQDNVFEQQDTSG